MELKTLTPELAVAAQIRAPDLQEIANAGFRTVICNRPDGEGNDQPVFAELEAAARGMGVTLYFLPAESGKVTDEQGRQFGALMDASPKPVLAFCRTGMRSTTGQALAIRYDLSSNTIAFVEDDWFADVVRSTSVPPRAVVSQRLASNVTRLVPRRR